MFVHGESLDGLPADGDCTATSSADEPMVRDAMMANP